MVGIAAVLALGACGGDPEPAKPKVAALPGKSAAPSAGASAPAAADTNDVRQLKLGATEAEVDRAYDAYYACWTAAGIPSTKIEGHDGGPLLTVKQNPKKYQKQVDSCADKEPLNPPELDPKLNPDYWDQLRDEQKCNRDKGLPLGIRKGQEGLWVEPPTDANFRKVRTDEATKIQHDCEKQAYSKKK